MANFKVSNLYNALLGGSARSAADSGGNAGGVAPTAADGAAVTSGKSYAMGAWAEVAAAATVTVNWWITHLFANDLYFAGAEEFQIQLGQGAGGAEVAMTGSRARLGFNEAVVTAVGTFGLPIIAWNYSPFPLFARALVRIAAAAGAASASNRAIQVGIGWRSGIGT